MPGHTYVTPGDYTPSVTVNFAGGTSCTVNGPQIRVFALPVAKYVITSADSMCFKNNRLCILDQSVAGSSGAPIKKRIFQLNNGFVNIEDAPYANTLCYENNINFNGFSYTMVVEVTDTNNCSSRLEKPDSVVLHPRMQPISFSATYKPSCFGTAVTFSNTSTLTLPNVKKFYWDFNDGQMDSTNWSSVVHNYTMFGSFSPKLFTIDRNNCRDTAVAATAVENIIPDSTIYISTPKAQCFNGNKFKFVSNNSSSGNTFWTVYSDNNDIVFTGISIGRTDTFAVSFNTCGRFRVNMKVQLPDCSAETDTFVFVNGPIAIIQNDTHKVLNRTQCEISDTIYFKTPVPYLSCRFGNGPMEHVWDFDDAFALPCTTDTKLGINVTMNCNFSKDSMNVKHAYTPGRERCYYPKLYMTDPVLGCTDMDSISLALTQPDAGWDSTATPVRRGLFYRNTTKPCLNTSVIFSLKETLPICGLEKAWFNPDSACNKNNWVEIPNDPSREFSHSYASTCDSVDGYVTVGLIIKNGKDKNGNDCYDTAWYHHMLKMTPLKPEFTLKSAPTCSDVTIRATPDDSTQYNLNRVTWRYAVRTWDDIESYQLGIATEYTTAPLIHQVFSGTDSIIHAQQIRDTMEGVYSFTATYTNNEGCSRAAFGTEARGVFNEFYKQRTVYCLEDSVPVIDFVRYYNGRFNDNLSPVNFWADPARSGANKEQIWWNMGDGKGFAYAGSAPKVKYDRPGKYTITMVTRDSLGCMDTLVKPDYIVIVEPQAKIGSLQAAYYCAPQIVLFRDSSIVRDAVGGTVTSPLEPVTSWLWSFDDGKPGSILQHPAHNYTSNGLFNVTLFIETASGCKDSASVKVDMKGPRPLFTILDTMGCAPFTATFINTTGKQLQSWTWYFGDPANQTQTMLTDSSVRFTYTAAGVYNVGLLGSENIFNPGTGNTFNCLSYFPDSLAALPVRKVYVLRTPPIGIVSKDSICPNEIMEFAASGDSIYTKFNWSFGDSTFASSVRPDTIVQHTFKASGIYNIRMIPFNSSGFNCVDTVTKSVFVSSVKADFDLDDSKAPFYSFTNTSQNAVRYVWDFGKPAAGSLNQSVQKDATFDYSKDTGTFTICLIAYNADDCWDSICRQTKPDARVTIPNVFTPGNNDGKNDAYDIDIAGYSHYDLKIYNRWGVEVYESGQDGHGNDGINWNGKDHNDGPLCADGVYYFIFSYKLVTEPSQKTVRGTITLIRDKH
jgi:gliding motility-associated-like protein